MLFVTGSRGLSIFINMDCNPICQLKQICRLRCLSASVSLFLLLTISGCNNLSETGSSSTKSALGSNFRAGNGMELVWVPALNGWAGKYLVTQEEYQKVLGVNPSLFISARHPVERVSWYDAIAYCHLLTQQDHASGRLPKNCEYSLPTDAQWTTLVANATTKDAIMSIDVKRSSTEDVGTRASNQYGLYDILGNVWEWCLDWYRASLNPPEVISGYPFLKDDQGGKTYKVVRGGSWYNDDPLSLNIDCRGRDVPVACVAHIGFRVVVIADKS